MRLHYLDVSVCLDVVVSKKSPALYAYAREVG